MPERTAIYMIAIIPPEPINSEVQEFKKIVADKYRSKEALRRPVHITLIPPFQTNEKEEKKFRNFVEGFAAKQTPFEIAFDGFEKFGNRVIYVHPIITDEFKKMEKQLSTLFYKSFPFDRGASSGFHPHMTIAFKDLTPDMFVPAWNEFQDTLYRRRFMLDNICLLRHNGKEWVVIDKAMFGSDGEVLSLGF
jgi:2'-5' RNA ligase